MKNSILIIGGDSRQLYMADYLESKGYEITLINLPEKRTECAKDLKSSVESADIIIFPLPLTKDGKNIFSITAQSLPIETAFRYINENHLVFGGMINSSTETKLKKKTNHIFDYFKLEEVTVKNTVPTVQGIIKIIIDNIEYTINGSKCAVFGYGRTAKLTAEILKSFGAEVTVCARKEGDRASAEIRGMKSTSIEKFSLIANKFDIIINTIPSVIIGRRILENLNKNCMIIDVSSAPYGVDYACASEFSINAMQCPSLPGKIAPKTAGEIIGNAIIKIIKEENRE